MITVIEHTGTTAHSLFNGYWVKCSCGWTGPARATKHLAEAAHTRHVRDAKP